MSQAGVDAARRVGDSTGPFAFVVVSDVPRTMETALAMGFAVDECELMGGEHFEAARRDIPHHAWWEWADPFSTWAEYVGRDGPVSALARDHEKSWRRAVSSVPDGAAALVISHGGLIEPGLVACFPHHPHGTWGPPFSNLEGARLEFDSNDGWVDMELLRVPWEPRGPHGAADSALAV